MTDLKVGTGSIIQLSIEKSVLAHNNVNSGQGVALDILYYCQTSNISQ